MSKYCKVALCLSGLAGHTGKYGEGQMLNSEIGFSYYKNNLLSYNPDIDIFIHSWSHQLQDKITEIYRPTKSKFEDNSVLKQIDNQRKFAIHSRWYSNKKVIELVEEYQKENNIIYDFVMISRFDIALKKPIIFSNLNPEYFYHLGTDPIHGQHNGPCCDPSSNAFEINDLWFISNFENINKFVQIYNNLDQLVSETQLSNHCIAAQQLRKIGLFNKRQTLLQQIDHNPPGRGDSPLIRWITD